MTINEVISICENTPYCSKCKCYDSNTGDCKYAALYPRDWIKDDEPIQAPETINPKPTRKKKG